MTQVNARAGGLGNHSGTTQNARTAMARSSSKSPPGPVAAPAQPTAADIMTREVVTVSTDMSVVQAAELLITRGVSNAPVVERDLAREVLVGFISEKDVMQCYASGRLYTEPFLRVGEIVRTHPVSVRPDADLFTLAAIFMQHGYRHLPVTVGQVLQGVVSRRDVLNALMTELKDWQFQPPQKRKIPNLSAIFTPRYLLG